MIRSTCTGLVMTALVLGPAMALAGPADGTGAGPAVRIERVDLASDGNSRVAISISGLPDGVVLAPDDVTLVENGRVVDDLRVAAAGNEPSAVEPALVLAVDTSESTQGEPIAAAVVAGQALVEQVGSAGFLTGLVEFGPSVTVHARLEDPAAAVTAGLASMTAAGSTKLYDGLSRAARLLSFHDGPRDIVVFSDGADNGSESTLATARSLLVDSEVRVTVVALESAEFDLAPLQAIAEATGGSLIRVSEADELLAAFEGVVEDLTTRYVLEWTSAPVPAPPGELAFELRLATEAGPINQQFLSFNPRVPAITDPVPYPAPQPLLGALSGASGLIVAGVTTFVSVLLLGALLFNGVGERRRRERLAERLAGWDGLGDAPDDEVVAAASLSSRAADAMDRLPKPRGLEQRLARLLERADWPMRPGEFQLLTLSTALAGVVVPVALLGSVPIAILGFAAGLAGPYGALRRAVSKRRRAFEEQLPTVLDLLAGALRAGHSLHTALEGTIREMAEPSHSELRRAAVEHRLGRPVAAALRGVADRMESSDLRWVVTAVSIQQEVGGNLAELLDNVSATLRDRASLGRQVRALSAEGRLSAIVIGVLPFVMFIAMTVINPDYTAVLYETLIGRFLLVVAVVLMAIGGLWLRQVVQPKY